MNRRMFLFRMAAGGLLPFSGLHLSAGRGFAMGSHSYPQGFREIRGEVRVNGLPAEIGMSLTPGDVVTTGPDSQAVFVIHTSVYLVRDNSRLKLDAAASEPGKEKIVDLLRIVTGKLMAVSWNRKKLIVTPTAILGIRGTGIYIEAETGQTYVCTCYGTVDIEAKSDPDVRETVRTSHHDAPRFVYDFENEPLIVEAPVFNHTDMELIHLEAFVGREPPFIQDPAQRSDY